MVDQVNNPNQVQQISSLTKKNTAETKSKDNTSAATQVDQVEISDEALSIAEASEAAKNASQALLDSAELSLSDDREKLNQLV